MNMISNLFSIFDPSSSFISTGWIIILTPLILFNTPPAKNLENEWAFMSASTTFVNNEVDQLMNNNIIGTSTIIVTLFLSLLLINIVAIFPFNFTPTAHISISLTMSISLWVSTIIFGWNNQFNNIIVHLTPIGTPNALINFMVIIEIVSSIIRPITLSVRLSANIVAGHLLMALLSSFSISQINNIVFSIIPMLSLITLETAVALVQAYVFITLIVLYQNETS